MHARRNIFFLASKVNVTGSRKKVLANSSLNVDERRISEQLSLARSATNTSLLIVGTNCLSPLSRCRGYLHVPTYIFLATTREYSRGYELPGNRDSSDRKCRGKSTVSDQRSSE